MKKGLNEFMRKHGFWIGLACVVFLFVLGYFNMTGNVTSGHCVEVAVSDISPSSIGIDEDFTVGILIDNCGSKVSDEVVFTITDISPLIEVKEDLVQDIGRMGYTNSKRFITFHMGTKPEAIPGEYIVKYRVDYSGEDGEFLREGEFSLTVIGEEAELNIASLKTDPVLPVKGEIAELTLRIENAGKGTAKSVEVYVNHSFQGLKQSFIGTLEPDEDGPAIFTFIVDKSGEQTFPVLISYYDDFGENQIEREINISVLKKPTNILFILFWIIILALFVGGIYYFSKVKKSKDNIIHQLLKGSEKKK
ncbi:hypothetical protein HN832_03955 [archaeon]|jgi:hypothetical protein|nr:hypothetical protein [archaeon]MBT4373452.1 hypothetical protein [archaeon]MBT4531900.1 hypothetical protein [archaeon]MBT7001567.1 hypothetical protein [archaeon]MBT7282541.1 hypothetical protein [archaeon]